MTDSPTVRVLREIEEITRWQAAPRVPLMLNATLTAALDIDAEWWLEPVPYMADMMKRLSPPRRREPRMQNLPVIVGPASCGKTQAPVHMADFAALERYVLADMAVERTFRETVDRMLVKPAAWAAINKLAGRNPIADLIDTPRSGDTAACAYVQAPVKPFIRWMRNDR